MRRFGGFKHTNSKFGSSKAEWNGLIFDSKYELQHYLYLLELQKEGKICGLRRQTPFLLIPKTTKIVPKQLKTKVKYVERTIELQALYHNDFTYFDNEKKVYVCSEFKSAMTCKLADYILRRKLMVKKIYSHNQKGRSQWVFREVVYINKKKTTITDK